MQVLVGRIGRAHGIRGEVVVAVRTDAPADRFAPGPRWAPNRRATLGWRARRLGVHWYLPSRVADRGDAEALSGTGLLAEVDPDEPATAEDGVSTTSWSGSAVSADGTLVGEMTVEHPGAQDLLVLTTGRREVLVPFVAAIVPEVDLAGGRVVLDPPPGLLDLEGQDERGAECASTS